MTAEISFDLDMHDAMPFVEGTFRLPGGDWQVFTIGPDATVAVPQVTKGTWASGVRGLSVRWPDPMRLHRDSVLDLLSAELGVDEWTEVRGPDSIMIR